MIPAELSLYHIETELAELFDLREASVAEGALPEELAAIDAQIEAYCSAEVSKVDRICSALHACERNMKAVAEEAKRLDERYKAWQARYNRIKDATLRAMQARGIRSLETHDNKLAVRRNGGIEPLDLSEDFTDLNRNDLEPRFHLATVKLRWDTWMRLANSGAVPEEELLGIEFGLKLEPNNSFIREALKRGEDVPGARLLPRGEHLRIE